MMSFKKILKEPVMVPDSVSQYASTSVNYKVLPDASITLHGTVLKVLNL